MKRAANVAPTGGLQCRGPGDPREPRENSGERAAAKGHHATATRRREVAPSAAFASPTPHGEARASSASQAKVARRARSEGAHLLEASGIAAREVARRLDVDHSLVVRWLAGEKRPGPELARRLEAITGGAVPAVSWSQISSEARAPSSSSSSSSGRRATVPAATSTRTTRSKRSPESALAMAREELREAREELRDTGLLPQDRGRIRTAVIRGLELVDRLERDRRIGAPAEILGSPFVRRTFAAIERALEAHPAALADFAAARAELEAEAFSTTPTEPVR